MGGWCKERYNKDENNKLEGLHQKPDQIERIRWEGQNFSEVLAPQEEEESQTVIICIIVAIHSVLCMLLSIDKFYIHFGGSLEY